MGDRTGLRAPLVGAGVFVAALAVMAVALPQGTKPGVVLNAAIIGLLEMLTVAGIVLVYRSARVVNFSQVALGAAGAALFYEVTSRGILPYAVALPVALLTGPLLGLIVGGLIAVLFFRSPRLVLTIVTIIVAGLMIALQGFINTSFRREGEISAIQPVLGPFPKKVVILSGFPFRAGHLIAAVVAIAAIAALAIFLRRSRLGIAVRGTAENADRAALLGINVRAVSTAVWVIAGTLAGLSSVLVLPIIGYAPGRGANPAILLPALTAAVVAGMTNLPVAMGAAFAITVLRSVLFFSFPQAGYMDVLLFAAILITLFLRKPPVVGRGAEESTWRALKEFRPVPKVMTNLRAVGWTRWALAGIAVAAVLGFPWVFNPSEQGFAAEIMITAMIGISLVVLTGWSGQISLGQTAFAAVGAFAEAILAGRMGIPIWFALPLAGLATAAFAVLVGLPALRIRGLFLAVSTFALAVVVPDVFFESSALGRFLPSADITRPKLLFLDFADQRSMYYLVLGVFALIFFSARALRRGRTGRLLIALRDDEAGTRSFGVDAVRTRLAAFVLAGFYAGLAGGVLVHLSEGVGQGFGAQFNVGASIAVFTMTIVGGIGAIGGPILGAIYFLGIPRLFASRPQIGALLVQGLTPILVLLFIPGGLLQAVYGVRDAILRVIAIRRHIVVPTLFADYNPDAWERRQAPLAPAQQGRGLGTLKPGQRYKLPSKLWGADGAPRPDEVPVMKETAAT